MLSKTTTLERKAHASCLGASYLLLVIGLHVEVGSIGGGSSSRRLGQLTPGLRHLVAAIGYGEKGSKATVSTHPKYS